MSSLYAIESFTQVWRRCPGSRPLPGIRDGVSRPHQPQCCTRFPELKSAAGTGVPGSCGHESSSPPALTWSNPSSSTSLITITLAFASPPSSTAQMQSEAFCRMSLLLQLPGVTTDLPNCLSIHRLSGQTQFNLPNAT